MDALKSLLARLNVALLALQKQYMNSDTIYLVAKGNLGKHLTLNPDVPPEVGCAEAVSTVLKQAGIAVPTEGIAGTAALYAWLPQNGFSRADTPQAGDIIVSPTGMGNGTVRGHTGVVGNAGILSNDSQSGLFLELWTIDKWQEFYGSQGGLPVAFFRL